MAHSDDIHRADPESASTDRPALRTLGLWVKRLGSTSLPPGLKDTQPACCHSSRGSSRCQGSQCPLVLRRCSVERRAS